MKFHSYIVKVNSFAMFTCLFIYAKLCYRKRVLYVCYLKFCFLDSQIKHFSVSFRLSKTYVADQKPQPIISFIPIYRYTKLSYGERGLNHKHKHKLSQVAQSSFQADME